MLVCLECGEWSLDLSEEGCQGCLEIYLYNYMGDDPSYQAAMSNLSKTVLARLESPYTAW